MDVIIAFVVAFAVGFGAGYATVSENLVRGRTALQRRFTGLTGFGKDKTRYPYSCCRLHDWAVTG